MPLVEAGGANAPDAEAIVRRSLAPLLATMSGHAPASETGAIAVGEESGGSFVFPIPPGAHVDTLLLGCTHYPLLADLVRSVVGPGVAVIDSATATASALASLLEVHDLGAAEDAEPEHLQLTTGDVRAFTATSRQLFGERFAAAEPITLETATGAMIRA